MATVYLADDLKHRRKVALKVMRPELAAAIGPDRFLREIEVAARLSHPHVLPLFDSGAAAGQLYYVMPYVAGESLRARLDRERQLPLEEALRLAREIAGALGHAHAQGLVHRDVKPENVLLSDGIAMVADFGIARATSRDAATTTIAATHAATEAGFTLGTPLYMAPEQAAGDAGLDGRADQYGLACVLYEMLAGQPPFTAGSVPALLARHARDPVPPLRSVRPGIPDAVERVIEKALAKAPADRHAGMARFAEALAMAVAGARTPTPAPAQRERAVPGNLPKQRTSFVGRVRELAECARRMGETRLLTLTGVGGCGKTRLGLRLAESLLETHPDGAWWVDLAPVSEDSRLTLALATTLGVQEEAGRPLLETIARHLEGRRVLLVLDNCEHLLAATAEAADALLSATEHVRILVTSREGLGIEGEHVFALRSLGVPSAAAQTDLHAVEESDAVQLFVDRARLASSDFALTAATAPAVAEICRRLDGMPLAIELAAARIKMLTAEQIRARLDDRFKLLTGGSKALARHQTLRATIQWSVDQLEPPEQALFRDLAVFAGGWTLPDAVAVAGEDADEFDVLDRLTHLADKSLVTVGREDGEARYSMLETVRQYALEMLNASPGRDAVRGRHLGRFVRFVQDYDRRYEEQPTSELHRMVDRELENILAAHVWCDHAENGAELGLALLVPLRRYCPDRGLLELGMRVIREALARGDQSARTGGRARALSMLSDMCYFRGTYGDALATGREALGIARGLAEPMVLLSALDAAACAAYAAGEVQQARALCEEYVAEARSARKAQPLTSALTYLGEILRSEGDAESALRIYDELLPMARHRHHPAGLAITLGNFAMLRATVGDVRGALAAIAEAAGHAADSGSKRIFVAALDVTAGLAALLGEPATTARFYGASETAYARTGAQREPADARFHDPLRRRAEEAMGSSEFATAHAAGGALPLEAAFAEAHVWLKDRAAGS
ncbi:MAG: protein kinase [Candidatus Eisenbacteria bacterium]|nr:protein kinase [Candidatus Eisenbacteria bacterium]